MAIDPNPLYQFFNASKDYQKSAVDKKIAQYQECLYNLLLDKYKFNKSKYFQLELDKLTEGVGFLSIYGSKKQVKFAPIVPKVSTNLFNILERGNSIKKRNTLVELNFDLVKLIKSKSTKDLVKRLYPEIDFADPSHTNLVDYTPIDLKSLNAFIQGNEQLHYQNATIQKYHQEASLISQIAEYFGGKFPQIINESNFGRRYYKGMNLQNCSKVVRHAALGDCYEYDLNASVYAIKLNICSVIDPTKKFTYTSEYIENGGKYKDSIRKRLAKSCFGIDESFEYFDDRLAVIKRAITAIGFGATKTSKGYFDKNNSWKQTSLQNIFSYQYQNTGKRFPYICKMSNTQKLALDEFLTDPWMREFISEQDEMTNMIVNYVKPQLNKDEHPFLVDGRNAFNKARIMAYVYQSSERNIMDFANEYIEQSGGTVLLRVHDAIYTREPINLKELHWGIVQAFLSDTLADWLGNKVICFEPQDHNGYTYQLEDESDIDEAFTKLTGVQHTRSKYHIKTQYTPKQTEGFYDGGCDYGQQEYDPYNDRYIKDMTQSELKEHYRIVGYEAKSNLPRAIEKHLKNTLKT